MVRLKFIVWLVVIAQAVIRIGSQIFLRGDVASALGYSIGFALSLLVPYYGIRWLWNKAIDGMKARQSTTNGTMRKLGSFFSSVGRGKKSSAQVS